MWILPLRDAKKKKVLSVYADVHHSILWRITAAYRKISSWAVAYSICSSSLKVIWIILYTLEILRTVPHTNPEAFRNLWRLTQSKQMAFLTFQPDEKCSRSNHHWSFWKGKGIQPNTCLHIHSQLISLLPLTPFFSPSVGREQFTLQNQLKLPV